MSRRDTATAALVLAVGVSLRMWLTTLGHNYDMESWWIVAQAAEREENVYAATTRFTTGPVWFVVLGWLQWLPAVDEDPFFGLQRKVNLLLTLVDVGIALLLLRRCGLGALSLFMLNPVTALITGYHLQFDNVAVLMGLLAAAVVDDAPREEGGTWFAALALVGLSLATKHVFFALPFWLAFQANSWRARFLRLSIPYGVFGLGFALYWDGAEGAIVNNVLRYESFRNGPLWSVLFPGGVGHSVPTSYMFVGTMILFGWLVRRRSAWELVLVYLVAVVVLSSALANQYLAIPAPAIAASANLPFVVYSILGAGHIVGSRDGLGVSALRPPDEVTGGLFAVGYPALVVMLATGLGLMLWRQRQQPGPQQ